MVGRRRATTPELRYFVGPADPQLLHPASEGVRVQPEDLGGPTLPFDDASGPGEDLEDVPALHLVEGGRGLGPGGRRVGLGRRRDEAGRGEELAVELED